MADVNINTKNKRGVWQAVALSLLAPGLGHVYCGKLIRGLALMFLAGIIIIAIFGILAYQPIVRSVIFGILLFTALFAIPLIAAIDSYHVARRTKGNYELKEYNRWYVYVLLILLTCGGTVGYSLYTREHYIEAFWTPTRSNYPTILPGDRVLANKVVYDTCDPQRGDLVVIRNPGNRRQHYIKRIVALEGDTVEIKNDDLYINGEKLKKEELYQSKLDTKRIQLEGTIFHEFNGDVKYKIFLTPNKDHQVTNFRRITVPKHHCFTLGDNRHFSRDSRHYGSVPLVAIIGRVDYLYCPAQGWSRFGRIDD